jgi:peptidoglycan hydrolase CwlO-like protein
MAEVAERIGTLEIRVDRLETWAGPGQAETLAAGVRVIRADIAGMRRVQNQHTAMLTTLKSDVANIKSDVGALQSDVGALQSDVAGLKSEVAGLKADVAGLKADVAGLKADVAGLKSDVAELKVAVREILRRLPPGPAASD